MIRKSLLVLAFALFASVAQGAVTCGSVALPKRPLRYCYEDRVNQASKAIPKVVYLFHGIGGSENDVFRSDFKFIIDALEAHLGHEMPIIVSLSVGSEGVVGYDAKEILTKGLAKLETGFAAGKSFDRFVAGMSMGGHNALRVAAEDSSRFVGAAGLCPALATFDAHDAAQVAAYRTRNAAHLDSRFFERVLKTFRRELPTSSAWFDNDPFGALDRGAYDGLPLYVSVGSEDSLGFYEGMREFKARSDLRPGMSVESIEVEGTHCQFDVEAFFNFMLKAFNLGG